jgi:hypothetical protein
MKYFIVDTIEKVSIWIANRLPRRLVYHAGIRLWDNATTGECNEELILDVTVSDALYRWGKRRGSDGK